MGLFHFHNDACIFLTPQGPERSRIPGLGLLGHLTLEMLAYGRQKPAFSHFVARIFLKILAEQLTHFIRYLL